MSPDTLAAIARLSSKDFSDRALTALEIGDANLSESFEKVASKLRELADVLSKLS